MDTSRSKGKRLESVHAESVHPESVQKGAFLISIAVKEDARSFGSLRAGEFVPNVRGRALADCWRELGRVRQGIRPDALLIGPRHVQGILILSPDGKDASPLSDAVRLFKVLASLRLSQASKSARQTAKASSTSSATETSVSLGKSPSALWKKGYTERPLAGASDLAEARKALKRAS